MSNQDWGEEKEICRIYRQFDGYPDGHGRELAALCDRMIVNGIPGGVDETTIANGMDDLAAQIVMGLKKEHPTGGIYLKAPVGPIDYGQDYIYIVRGKTGEKPTIECHSEYDNKCLFKGTAEEFLNYDFDKDNEDE